MIARWVGILCLCILAAACGGRKKAAAPPPGVPEAVSEGEHFDLEGSLAEQLSEKRLQELLAKSGLKKDPVLEAELKKWDQVLKIDLPMAVNQQVKAYLVYFSTERKEIFTRYLARSTRYLPMIREIFQEYGLPEDLAYLAMVESGFNPHAYSPAHAVGMWQFIAGTARRYGLLINQYVDERRDPAKATHAAAKYLLDLYKQFGSWYLAAASYNCGEGRVQRELDSSNHRNFFELCDHQRLPTETKNYVPQMIAATIIAKNPEKFGFTRVPYLPPLEYETVKVTEPTSLRAAALACNVPPEEMELLNPELRKGMTPPDQVPYLLKIPKHARERFQRNIQWARIEAPAVLGASLSLPQVTPRRAGTRPEMQTVREDRTVRTTRKSSGSLAPSPSSRQGQKPEAAKGKSGTPRTREAEVQVAAIFGAGKSPSGSRREGRQKGKEPPAAKGKKKPLPKKESRLNSSAPRKAAATGTGSPAAATKAPAPGKKTSGRRKSGPVRTATGQEAGSS